MNANESAIKTSILSILWNLILAIVKYISGLWGNSYALIADAIESTTDVFASLLVFLGLKYASKPADENHPYGHGRIEPLITFVVVAFLVVSASLIAFNSIENIRTPHPAPESWTLMVLAIIIIWKELAYQYILKKSRETGSSALKADAWHHRSDAVTSFMAFIGIGIGVIFGENYAQADDWAALFASFFILYNSYRIFRPALGEIMDEHQYDELIDSIRAHSLKVKGIIATEKCYVRKTGLSYHVDLHAIVDGRITVKEGHDIAHRLKDHLIQQIPQLDNVLIHIEPGTNV